VTTESLPRTTTDQAFIALLYVVGALAMLGVVAFITASFGAEVAIVLLAVGAIPAIIASRKGRSFLGWWLFGLLAWIVALPASVIVSDLTRVRCPHCAELVREEATLCPHCQRDFQPVAV
jgi:hypothetical protein